MTAIRILTSAHQDEWTEVLGRAAPYDFYHRPQYHALAEENGEGLARLLVYDEGEYTLALPLLMRPVEEVAGLEQVGRGWNDATSVYGYAGPLTSHSVMPAAVIGNFQKALQQYLREMRVLAVFSRLHPLFVQQPLLHGLGELVLAQETVSVDLSLPVAVQEAQYRRDHNRGIKKLKRLGVICYRVSETLDLHEFVHIYHETMRRLKAAARYFFSAAYFASFVAKLAPQVHLFVCRWEGQTVCAALIVECQGIVQYHLSGTLREYLKLAPMKLLVDTVRHWAQEQGLRVFHLGGGATGHPDDSLLHFKTGFSRRRHPFLTWRWVLVPEVYRHLCDAQRSWRERQGMPATSSDFFPEYRCPALQAPLLDVDQVPGAAQALGHRLEGD